MKSIVFLFFCCFFVKADATCPDGSVEFQQFCYFFEANATNFPNAELACNKLNGHLASIHDGFTNAILTGQSGNYFHESTVTNFWDGLNSLLIPGNWTWTDNTTFNFKEWAPSEPQNLTMACGTVAIQNGLWASDDCFKMKPYVCAVPSSAPSTAPPYGGNCSEGWMYFEPTNSCYGRNGYGHSSGNWTTIEKYCESDKGAHSVSIHSYNELKFVSDLISIGSNYVWTGMFSNDDEKSWKWSDESAVDYLPWCSGYPTRNISSCVGVWNECFVDFDCNSSLYTLCKKPSLT